MFVDVSEGPLALSLSTFHQKDISTAVRETLRVVQAKRETRKNVIESLFPTARNVITNASRSDKFGEL